MKRKPSRIKLSNALIMCKFLFSSAANSMHLVSLWFPRASGSGLLKGWGSTFLLKLQGAKSPQRFPFPCPPEVRAAHADSSSSSFSQSPTAAHGARPAAGQQARAGAVVSLAVHHCHCSNFLAVPTLMTSKHARTHALLSLTSRTAGAGYEGESLSQGLGCLSNWFEGDLSVPP